MKVAVLLAASLALLVADSTSTPEKLRFTPTEGLKLELTFREFSDLNFDPESSQESSTPVASGGRVLVVTDEILAVDSGRVVRVARTYGEVTAEFDLALEDAEERRATFLSGSGGEEGFSVVFEWDEGKEEYVATNDEMGDDAFRGLTYDRGFTALLPSDAVTEGDEWSVDIAAFGRLVNPWEGIPWEQIRAARGEPEDRSFDKAQVDVVEQEGGKIVAAFRGVREVDGIGTGVITLEGATTVEITSDMTHGSEDQGSSSRGEYSISRVLKGEALWDLNAGRLRSMEIRWESTTTGETVYILHFQGKPIEMRSDVKRESIDTFSVSVTVVE